MSIMTKIVALSSTLTALAMFVGPAALADNLDPTGGVNNFKNLPDVPNAVYSYVDERLRLRIKAGSESVKPITEANDTDARVPHVFKSNDWRVSTGFLTGNGGAPYGDFIEIDWDGKHLTGHQPEDGKGDPFKGFEERDALYATEGEEGRRFKRFKAKSATVDHGTHIDKWSSQLELTAEGNDILIWKWKLNGDHKKPREGGKKKDIYISETIEKTVTIDLAIAMDFAPASVSQANGSATPTIDGNTFGPGLEATQNALIEGAVEGNSGITAVQQSTGIGFNQGVALSVGEVAAEEPALADAQMDMEQIVTDNIVFGDLLDGDVVLAPMDTMASMTSVVHSNVGVTVVQQIGGVANNQNFGLAMAMGLGSEGTALSDADLSQALVGNLVENISIVSSATLTDAVTQNTGITVVQQAGGSLGNQGVNIAIAGTNDLVF